MKQKIIFFILAYFRFFAQLQLKKNHPLIIGITGSAGKTSTKNAVASILKNKYQIKTSETANSETGLPLNILGLTPKTFSVWDWLRLMISAPIKLALNWEKYDIYVAEMGIDSPKSPKNMSYLLTILQPNIGIILNAGAMHSEPFDYLIKDKTLTKRREEIIKLIAQEKGKLVTELNGNETAIINHDQQEIWALKKNIRAKVISFGTHKNSYVRFISYQIDLTGTKFEFQCEKLVQSIHLKNQLLPKHFGLTFASSIACGLVLGIKFEDSCRAIKDNFKLPKGRATLIRGINGSLIIDSSYNSSKKPLLDMLDMLKKLSAKRKIAVLGDMREMGQVTKLEHQEIATKVTSCVDVAILIGPKMKKFALPVIQHKIEVHWFSNAYQASSYLKTKVNQDDLILIKGSQNTLMLEIVTKAIMAKPEKARQLLARRGKFWDSKRAQLK